MRRRYENRMKPRARQQVDHQLALTTCASYGRIQREWQNTLLAHRLPQHQILQKLEQQNFDLGELTVQVHRTHLWLILEQIPGQLAWLPSERHGCSLHLPYPFQAREYSPSWLFLIPNSWAIEEKTHYPSPGPSPQDSMPPNGPHG